MQLEFDQKSQLVVDWTGIDVTAVGTAVVDIPHGTPRMIYPTITDEMLAWNGRTINITYDLRPNRETLVLKGGIYPGSWPYIWLPGWLKDISLPLPNFTVDCEEEV